jgi:hypothetical protein
MEDIGRCKKCKHYQGLVDVPNGFLDILKKKINCLKFGYLELLIDADTCTVFNKID